MSIPCLTKTNGMIMVSVALLLSGCAMLKSEPQEEPPPVTVEVKKHVVKKKPVNNRRKKSSKSVGRVQGGDSPSSNFRVAKPSNPGRYIPIPAETEE